MRYGLLLKYTCLGGSQSTQKADADLASIPECSGHPYLVILNISFTSEGITQQSRY